MDNKGLTTRERCTRPSCTVPLLLCLCLPLFYPLPEKVLVLHTRDIVRLRKLSVPHDLRGKHRLATYRYLRNIKFLSGNSKYGSNEFFCL